MQSRCEGGERWFHEEFPVHRWLKGMERRVTLLLVSLSCGHCPFQFSLVLTLGYQVVAAGRQILLELKLKRAPRLSVNGMTDKDVSTLAKTPE